MAPSFVMSYTLMIQRVSLMIPVIPSFLTLLVLEIEVEQSVNGSWGSSCIVKLSACRLTMNPT